MRKKGKMIVNAKKITIDGINFASTLESTMYKLLKESGIEAGYESQVYVLVDGFAYKEENWERTRKDSPEMSDKRKAQPMRYTPDFVSPDESFVIEVKGRPNERFPVVWKLFKDLMNKRDKPPVLFMPKSKVDCEQVIKILKDKGYGRKSS
jgi:hypothetical protein